jgi:hypothetical protein
MARGGGSNKGEDPLTTLQVPHLVQAGMRRAAGGTEPPGLLEHHLKQAEWLAW